MLSLKSLFDYSVLAADGEVGSVYDFYFNDKDWAVRYLVISGAEGVGGRPVLVAARALGAPEATSQSIPTSLTMEQATNSPAFNPNQPLSREQEIELNTYYEWPFYWEADPAIGPGLAAYPLVELASEIRRQQREEAGASTEGGEANPEPSLRLARGVLGYVLQARDGEIGTVDDFIVDEQTYRIGYIVVDTGGWLSSRKVLVSPTWVQEVSWATSAVSVDLSRETIENSPEFEPERLLDADYAAALGQYYRPRQED
jgi:sporulation protein YlmC with PRC-barrel domain